MGFQELHDLLFGPKFRPFRLHITDGKSHEVRHAWQCMLLVSGIVVGEPDKELGPPVLADYENYRFADLAKVEFLAEEEVRESA